MAERSPWATGCRVKWEGVAAGCCRGSTTGCRKCRKCSKYSKYSRKYSNYNRKFSRYNKYNRKCSKYSKYSLAGTGPPRCTHSSWPYKYEWKGHT